MTAELVPTTTFDADPHRWAAGIHFVGEWLAEHSGHTRAAYADAIGWPYRPAGTWRGYHTTRNGHTWLNWCHGAGIHLLDAKRIHVLAWIDAFTTSLNARGEPLSKRSRAQLVSAASSFYRWAMHNGHTEINPVALVDRRKKQLNTSRDPSPSRSLFEAETQALIVAADDDPVKSVRLRTSAIIALLFCVGPRVGELCNATLADMRVMDGRRALYSQLKGSKEHFFALPPEVCARIDAYLASREDITRLPARRGSTGASTTPLIATSRGKPMGRGEVRTLVKRIAKLAGLDDPQSVHPHVGRHTFITEARRLGYAGDTIQQHVGYADIATTDKYGKHIINIENSPAYGVAARFAPGAHDE